MASRYWVGGSGTWSNTSTTHWSTSSGGPGGASAPTSNDDVYFDSNSGGGTITVDSRGLYPIPGLVNNFFQATVLRNFITTGFTGSFEGLSTFNNGFYNILVFGPTMNISGGSFSNKSQIVHYSPSGTCTSNIGSKYIWYQCIALTNSSVTISGIDNVIGVNLDGKTGIASQGATGTSITVTGNIVCTQSPIDTGGGYFGVAHAGAVNIGSGTISARYIYFTNVDSLSGSRVANMNGGTNSVITNFYNANSGAITNINITGGSGGASLNCYSATHPSVTITGVPSLSVSGSSGASYTNITTLNVGSVTVSENMNIAQMSVQNSNTFFSSNCLPNGTIGQLSITGTPSVTFHPSGPALVNNFYLSGCSTLDIATYRGDVTISSWTLNGISGTTTVNAGLGRVSGSPDALLNAVISTNYTFTNITWKNIRAGGNIPWRGSGFVDGGNTLNIEYVSAINSLFFGSNF